MVRNRSTASSTPCPACLPVCPPPPRGPPHLWVAVSQQQQRRAQSAGAHWLGQACHLAQHAGRGVQPWHVGAAAHLVPHQLQQLFNKGMCQNGEWDDGLGVIAGLRW